MRDVRPRYSLPDDRSVFAHLHFWLAVALLLATLGVGTAFILFEPGRFGP